MAKYGQFKYGQALYGGDTLWVFDRTIADLQNKTSKVYYNYTDLNRIETRSQELEVILSALGYPTHLTFKTNWAKVTDNTPDSNFPVLSQLNRIIYNLKKLRAAFYTYNTTPKTPDTMVKSTIYSANDIEKILYDMYRISLTVKDNLVYCGTINCGGDYI